MSIVYNMQGTPLDTKRIQVADVANSAANLYMNVFPSTVITGAAPDGRTVAAEALIITCETNDARWTVGSAEANATTGVGHIMYVGDPPLRIVGGEMIRTMKICNKTVGSPANIQVTPECF